MCICGVGYICRVLFTVVPVFLAAGQFLKQRPDHMAFGRAARRLCQPERLLYVDQGQAIASHKKGQGEPMLLIRKYTVLFGPVPGGGFSHWHCLVCCLPDQWCLVL